MATDGYVEIRNRQSAVRYILGSVLLFHSFLPGALALQVAFWIDELRHPGRQRFLTNFGRAFAFTLLFTLPWAWWLRIRGQNLNFTIELIKQHVWQHYLYIHTFIVPFFLIGALSFQQVRKTLKSNSNAPLFFIIIAVNLLLFTVNHPYFFRYLVPLIPLIAYLTALIITSLPLSASLIAMVLIAHMSWRTFPGYLYEITHPYVGTNERLIKWLSNVNQPTVRSLATNYDDFTFRFHTPMIVYGAQHLPTLTPCPDVVVIYAQWGNEDRLKQIAADCSLNSVHIPI